MNLKKLNAAESPFADSDFDYGISGVTRPREFRKNVKPQLMTLVTVATFALFTLIGLFCSGWLWLRLCRQDEKLRHLRVETNEKVRDRVNDGGAMSLD